MLNVRTGFLDYYIQYITYYLKAAALLLHALERLERQQSTRQTTTNKLARAVVLVIKKMRIICNFSWALKAIKELRGDI